MDEATSALDNNTEGVVHEAIENTSTDKTLIIIAHRLATIERCDLIYALDRGAVITSGTYDELASDNHYQWFSRRRSE